MKTLPILLLACLIHAASSQAEQAHNHHADKDVLTQLVLNHGAKWPVDQVLSQAMLRLRTQMLTHLDDIHHKRFTASQYQQFSQVLQQEVNHIVANCKLTPESDAQFHLILAAMMQSQQSMAKDDVVLQRQGAVQLLRALQRYPEYFHDDAFLPLVH